MKKSRHAAVRYTEEEKDFLEKQSTENLIDMYRQELLRIVRGEKCHKLLPKSVRRRFRNYGILSKIGGIYKVTSRGKEMLGVVDNAEGL